MQILIFLVVFGVTFFTFKNFTKGFVYIVALRLLIPASVRMIGIGISVNTFLTFVLFLSFCIHRLYVIKMPSTLRHLIMFWILTSLLIVPFAYSMSVQEQLSNMFSFFVVDLLLGIMGWYAIRKEVDFQFFIKVLFITIAIIGIYGIYEYITKSNPYSTWAIETFNSGQQNFSVSFLQEKRGVLDGRIMGTSFHPLAWGLQMGLLLMFVCMNSKKHSRRFVFFLVTLIVVNAFLCGARTALVMVFLYALISLYLNFRFLLRRIILLLFSVLLLSFLIPKNETTKIFVDTIESSLFFWNEKKSDEVGVGGSSVSMRLKQLAFSFELIKDQLWVGQGYGFSSKVLAENSNKYATMMGFESILFRKIVDQGILGTIFFFLFYLFLMRYAQKVSIGSSVNLVVFLLIYMVGLIFTGMQNTFYLFFTLLMVQLKYNVILRRVRKKDINRLGMKQ